MSCGSGDKANQMSVADVQLKEVAELKPSLPLEEKELNKTVAGIAATDTSSNAASSSNDSILNSGGPTNIDWDKKIIKNAHVTLELKDYNAYNSSLHNKLKSYGAYIAQEQETESDDQIANDITIKVPVEKFDDLMNSLPGDGIKVLEKTISTEDVTGEVVDTKARIEAKKEVRARYLDLLKQAKSMKDILEVQDEINGIQEDIESASGRVNYLTHAAAYSTINLKYYQFLNGIASKDIKPGFLSNVSEAFKTGSSVITNLILFFISIWPLVIAGILLIFYYQKLRLKKSLAHVPSNVQNAQVSDTTAAQ
ncbi:DUF4349 domain-containing protein [Panacibacter ginsenosidivorans]|uniref:DUF4349 domain-containing protein n=2 Tax=Panacibacter ginsenosidivorans TaxID=1813871 RepID=A0A5B8V3G5_9BACT|nr:DUF4349 domain-containing protein [Panacibacter ginsenosidivorans]